MKSGVIKAALFGMTAIVGVKAADTMGGMGVDLSQINFNPSAIFEIAMAAEEPKNEISKVDDVEQQEAVAEAAPKSLLPEIMIDISKEREALSLRQAHVLSQEAKLDLARDALNEQHAQLLALKNEIEGLLKDADGSHVGDITKLVKMYSGMKPERASSILDSGDIAVSVQVIASMKESDAGPILAGMSPVRAQAISKIIFERSRLPADQDLNGIELN